MPNLERKKTVETRRIEAALRSAGFEDVLSYRQNSASIRVRVVDERFAGKSRVARERMVLPHLQRLPEPIQSDVTVLLLLTPAETTRSVMNAEFEDPVPSSL